MDNIPKKLTAQDVSLSSWIEPVNELSPAEARVQAMFHEILVRINAPTPSPLALALAAVLAIPDGAPPGRGAAP